LELVEAAPGGIITFTFFQVRRAQKPDEPKKPEGVSAVGRLRRQKPGQHDRAAGLEPVFVGYANNNASDGQYQNTDSNRGGDRNFLFGDGSVRLFKPTITIKKSWAPGTMADGEIILSCSY